MCLLRAGAYRIGRRGPAYQARLLHGLLMFQAGDAGWNGFLALLQQVFSSVRARAPPPPPPVLR